MIEIVAAFARAGVDTLVLKGAALAQVLYAPGHERSYFDIDLLVAPDRLADAATVLSALGYRNMANEQGIDDVGGVLHADLWTRLADFGNVSIDLHRRLPGCQAPPATAWTLLRSGAQEIRIQDRPVLTLDNAGLALHVALHVAQHGPQDVKAVADLRLGLERWSDEIWRTAATYAGELQALEAFSAGLRLLPEGEAVAVALGLDATAQQRLDVHDPTSHPRGTFHLDALRRARNTRERLAIARKALLPSPNWIRWEMRWAMKSRAHLAAAYALHLARTPLWAARAIRFRSQDRQR